MNMKLLLQSRTSLFSVPGGDTIQILKTAQALKALGCEVDVSTEVEQDVSSYDIVHIFNLMRPQEAYLQVANAKQQKKKVALSTIYGPYIEYDRKARHGIGGYIAKVLKHQQIEYLKIAARAVKNREMNRGVWTLLINGYETLQSYIIKLSDVFLPNSKSEMNRVWKDFPLAKHKPHVVVPNAVDAKLFDPVKVALTPEVEPYKDCILCVARIEGRKSQLNLVRAMEGLPWDLVLMGKPAPNHISYFNQVKEEAGSNVHLLGHVDHNLLPQFYKAAKVHCLISWMETPGLSSLEAGAMGCNLVITEKGDTRDYFGDYAYYCKPDSVESIRNAIIKSYQSPVNPALQRLILRKYTWDRAAEKTLEGYKMALES